MDTVAAWLKTHAPAVEKGKQGKGRAQLDELTAQLHRAEQNLEVEAAARRRAEQLAAKCQGDAKAAAKWAATLDEESALMHKQRAVLANDLRTAATELQQLRAGAEALQSSPTPSEQLMRQAREAQASWMQSQDCMRAMASAAAAAETRAARLQEQLAVASDELQAAKAGLVSLEAGNQAQAQELVASAGQISQLWEQLSRERSHGARLAQQLEAASKQALALEQQLRQAGLQPAQAPQLGMARALSEGEAGLLDCCAADRERTRGGVSVSLPSPLQPPPHLGPDLEASICNLSSPAAFSPPLQRAALANWAPNRGPLPGQPSGEAAGARKQAAAAQAAGSEGWEARAAAAFQLAPEKTQSASKIKYIRPSPVNGADSEAREPSPRGGGNHPAAPVEGGEATHPPGSVLAEAELLRGFHAASEMGALRASDFAPLRKYHPHFQADGPAAEPARERQPLSPVNRNRARPRRDARSPAQKSPLKPAALPVDAAADALRPPPPLPPGQEQCGPLGMGSRGGGSDPVTPPKERGGAAAAHYKGLLKLAHKVSPMRIAGRGGAGPDRGFPGF